MSTTFTDPGDVFEEHEVRVHRSAPPVGLGPYRYRVTVDVCLYGDADGLRALVTALGNALERIADQGAAG